MGVRFEALARCRAARLSDARHAARATKGGAGLVRKPISASSRAIAPAQAAPPLSTADAGLLPARWDRSPAATPISRAASRISAARWVMSGGRSRPRGFSVSGPTGLFPSGLERRTVIKGRFLSFAEDAARVSAGTTSASCCNRKPAFFGALAPSDHSAHLRGRITVCSPLAAPGGRTRG